MQQALCLKLFRYENFVSLAQVIIAGVLIINIMSRMSVR